MVSEHAQAALGLVQQALALQQYSAQQELRATSRSNGKSGLEVDWQAD